MKLLIARAGAGKSYWLIQQGGYYVACTHKSHRAVLIAIAEGLEADIPPRASIDDLIAIIKGVPKSRILLDDIDRTAPKICYSLLELAEKHEIIATATDKKRCTPLLERGAAYLENLPPIDLADVVHHHYPELPAASIREIAARADRPAVAIRLAAAISGGYDQPDVPQANILPIIVIGILAGTYMLRWSDLPDYWIAIIAAVMVWLRRILWKVVE